MNTRDTFLFALMLALGAALPEAKGSDVEGQFKGCSLNSPQFRQCVSSSAAATVQRDPTNPEARSVYTLAVQNHGTGAYESTVVLLPHSGQLAFSLAGEPVVMVSEIRPDGSAAISVLHNGSTASLTTFVNGIEHRNEAP